MEFVPLKRDSHYFLSSPSGRVMDNKRIAQIFQEIGDILEIKGENRFRVLAYRKAEQSILDLGRDLSDIYQEDPKKLLEIPGIGKDLAAKIVELLQTGKCVYYENLVKTFDVGLLEMLRVRGVGPKKVLLFFNTLQINSVEKLRQAAADGKLRELPGMGEKSETEIIKALAEYERHTERMMLSEALYLAEKIVKYLQQCPAARRVEYAGSLRRKRETVGDLDILVAVQDKAKNYQIVSDYFVKFPDVKSVIAKGETKTSVILRSGIQSDLRVIDEKVFGAALHYFTGSKDHNVTLRDKAKKMGLKVSEYGVFKLHNGKESLVAGKTEEEVFKAVGLPFIPVELRENRGEIEAAEKGKLPHLVNLKDLRGDLHVHSRWSDGQNEIEEIARAYYEAGFEYIALTDHSPAVAVAHGLTPERFELQWTEIEALNAEYEAAHKKGARPFKILKGTECDILPDGTMDLPDKVLKKMDIVVASVHSRFHLSENDQTKRILKALENPYITILGHPSGRLINRREPYRVDMEAVIDAAIAHRVALEINGQPARLDLFDFYCKLAQHKGALFAIDSDSHHFQQRSFLEFGVAVARRGWIEAKNVLNTMSLEGIYDFLAKKRKNNE